MAVPVAPEDQVRARQYRLLAHLLAAPPAATTLELLRQLEGDGASDYGRALGALAEAARAATPQSTAREYQDLFIGLGRGELVPFGSYYLTGFLNEKPLARLRDDMARLGMARAPEVKEPEDHIAALAEMMAGLIDGSFGEPQPLAVQKAFFETHLSPWATALFEDLEAAESARFYAPVGTLGRLLLEIERTAFGMEAWAGGREAPAFDQVVH